MPRYLSIDPAIYHLCWSSVSVTRKPIIAKKTRKTKRGAPRRQKWVANWYESLNDFQVHSLALVNLATSDDKKERKKQRGKYQAIRTLQEIIDFPLDPSQQQVSVGDTATIDYYQGARGLAVSPIASSSLLDAAISDPLITAIAEDAGLSIESIPITATHSVLDGWLKNDTFLVEEQPKGSSGIAPISFWLNGLLWGQSPSHASHFVHAKHKITAAELYLQHMHLQLPNQPASSRISADRKEKKKRKQLRYSYNKKIVTQAVLHMLQASGQKEVHDFIAKSTKQDDYCDTIMTALAFAYQHPQ